MTGNLKLLLGSLVTVAALLSGCGNTVEEADKSITERQSDLDTSVEIINSRYFEQGYQYIENFKHSSLVFNNVVNTFANTPTEHNLQATRKAWLALHNHWHKLDFYTFASSYLRSKLPELAYVSNHIHSYPIDPNLIDSNKRNTGLMKNLEYTLTAEALSKQHLKGQGGNRLVGLHAIEFLLWRNSLTNFQPQRQLTEAEKFRGLNEQDLPNARRLIYLQQTSKLINEFALELNDIWQKSQFTLLRLPADQQQRLLPGISSHIIKELAKNIQSNHAAWSHQYTWLQSSLASIDGNLLPHHKAALTELTTQLVKIDGTQGINITHHIEDQLDKLLKSLQH